MVENKFSGSLVSEGLRLLDLFTMYDIGICLNKTKFKKEHKTLRFLWKYGCTDVIYWDCEKEVPDHVCRYLYLYSWICMRLSVGMSDQHVITATIS